MSDGSDKQAIAQATIERGKLLWASCARILAVGPGHGFEANVYFLAPLGYRV